MTSITSSGDPQHIRALGRIVLHLLVRLSSCIRLYGGAVGKRLWPSLSCGLIRKVNPTESCLSVVGSSRHPIAGQTILVKLTLGSFSE